MSDDGVMKTVQHIIAEIKVGGNPLGENALQTMR